MRASGQGLKASQVLDLFYNLFESLVDDLPGTTISGTSTTPDNAFDNNTGTSNTFNNVAEYTQIDFGGLTLIKGIRHYGQATNTPGDMTFKLEALVNGVWTDCETGILSRLATWSAWVEVTTPLGAIALRFTSTVKVGGEIVSQIELKGVRVGASA